MRKNINIEQGIYVEIRKKALDKGVTVSELVTSILAEAIKADNIERKEATSKDEIKVK